MRFTTGVLLLGVVSRLCEAGLLRFRQPQGSTCTPFTVWQTVIINQVTTETITETETPGTVTILQQDPSSIAASMASVDTVQVRQSSELNPISNSQNTNNPVFTHSIHVSGFEATELAGDGSSVFYVSKGHSTTDWSFTPSASIIAETTTVTVSPVPAHTSAAKAATANDTTSHVPFTSPSAGWNYTNTESTAFDATGTGPTSVPTGSTLSPSEPEPIYSTDVVTVTAVSTQFVTATEAASSAITEPASLKEFDAPLEIFDDGALDKRQTCVLISATIGGQVASWCNNWAGNTVLTYTSWETTVTASPASKTEPTSLPTYPIPTHGCGEYGAFKVDFENLPVFSTTNNDTTDFPPLQMFNPYDHFYWGAGWSFVPPPRDPFPPHSGSRLSQFVQSPHFNNTGSPNAGLLEPSSFGCGPRNYNDNYWFNARSAWVGCDNNATSAYTTCDFVATGYQWDNTTRTEKVVVTQHFTIPPCPGFKNCHLRPINFNYQFYRLSRLNFYANVKGQIKSFWVDDLSLSWFNNSCEAGLARIGSRKK